MAIGIRKCVCGHEETVRGKGVRRGQNPAAASPCQKCAYLLGAIKGEYVGPHRPTPWDNLPPRSEICVGREFAYSVREHIVRFRIVAVERTGGELLGVSAPAYSVGGKTERDWSRSRASYAPEHTTVRVNVDPSITGVAPFEVERRFPGHFLGQKDV